jgi:F-box and leucine-rich repeat protein 2/20
MSIEALAHACSSNLKNLRMDWCLKITDASLRSLLQNCKLLVAIDVGCCDQITDASFLDREGNEFQAKLRILKISSCARLTVVGVSSMVESFKDLKYLGLWSCPLITKDSCEQAVLKFPSGCKVNFDVSLFEYDPSIEFF